MSKIHIQTDIDNEIIKILGNKRLAIILKNEIEIHRLLDDQKSYQKDYCILFNENINDLYQELLNKFRRS